MQKEMVLKKTFVILLIAIALVWISYLSVKKIYAGDDRVSMEPIFDGKTDSSLHLEYCLGQEEDLAGYFPGNEVQLKKYKTQKLKKIQEEWMGKKASVTIERYYFASHEDAIALPSISMGVSVVWYGWSKTKDIGDKTSWLGSDYVMFVKGTVLVKVCTGSRMMNKEERKDYTRKVAEAVEKKL